MTRYYFRVKDDFKGLLDYQKWVNESQNNWSILNKQNDYKFTENAVNSAKKTWYGENVTYAELVAGVKYYKSPELLVEIYNKVKDKIPQSIYNRLPKKKLKFNSLGLGVFSFDRAAMTLYRNKEFYSSSKKTRVDERDVIQKGEKFYHKADNSPVSIQWEIKENGDSKIRTSTKDLFAFFPKIETERHAVEFFVSTVASAAIKADEMLYSGVSAIIMVELLMLAGIKVKVNLVIGSSPTSNRNSFYGSIIPIKDYDESLDRNLLALMTSDPRLMRYDNFKGVISSYDHFNVRCPIGMGYATNASELKNLVENSGYAKTLKSKHRFYFGGTFSEKRAIEDIEQTINDVAKALEDDLRKSI